MHRICDEGDRVGKEAEACLGKHKAEVRGRGDCESAVVAGRGMVVGMAVMRAAMMPFAAIGAAMMRVTAALVAMVFVSVMRVVLPGMSVSHAVVVNAIHSRLRPIGRRVVGRGAFRFRAVMRRRLVPGEIGAAAPALRFASG
jgi:hypothetical protein